MPFEVETGQYCTTLLVELIARYSSFFKSPCLIGPICLIGQKGTNMVKLP